MRKKWRGEVTSAFALLCPFLHKNSLLFQELSFCFPEVLFISPKCTIVFQNSPLILEYDFLCILQKFSLHGSLEKAKSSFWAFRMVEFQKLGGGGGGGAYRLPLDSLAVSRTNKVLLN